MLSHHAQNRTHREPTEKKYIPGMRKIENHVFSRTEEDSGHATADGSQDDELAVICEAYAAKVAKVFEPAGRKRGAPWGLAAEMSAAKMIRLINPRTSEPEKS